MGSDLSPMNLRKIEDKGTWEQLTLDNGPCSYMISYDCFLHGTSKTYIK